MWLSGRNAWWLQTVSGNILFLRNTNNTITEATFFQNSPHLLLRNSASDCKVLETFMEKGLWKPFQLFCRILNYVYRITKAPSLHCWFQSRKQVKISWSQTRRVCFSVVTLLFAKKSLTQPTGVLEHCCEKETNWGSPLSRIFLAASLRWRRMSTYRNYLKQQIL
jgi:hypothetical protein